MWLLLVVVLLAPALASAGSQCEAIAPLCAHMPYNMTVLPNLLGHRTLAEAERAAAELAPLADGHPACSAGWLRFLCHTHFPVCTVLDKPIPPCRQLCRQVRADCAAALNASAGAAWPQALDCDQFPEHPGLCIALNVSATVPPGPEDPRIPVIPSPPSWLTTSTTEAPPSSRGTARPPEPESACACAARPGALSDPATLERVMNFLERSERLAQLQQENMQLQQQNLQLTQQKIKLEIELLQQKLASSESTPTGG